MDKCKNSSLGLSRISDIAILPANARLKPNKCLTLSILSYVILILLKNGSFFSNSGGIDDQMPYSALFAKYPFGVGFCSLFCLSYEKKLFIVCVRFELF